MPRSREILLPWDSQPQEAVRVNPEYAALGAKIWLPPGLVTSNEAPAQDGLAREAFAGGIGARFNRVTTERIEYTPPASSGDFTLVSVWRATAFHSDNCTFNGVFAYGAGAAAGHYIGLDVGGNLQAVSTEVNNWTVTPSGVVTALGRTYCAVATFTSGGGRRLFLDGRLVGTDSTSRSPGGLDRWYTGVYVSNAVYYAPFSGVIGLSGVIPSALSDERAAAISANPYAALFAPQTIWVPVSTGGGTVTMVAQDAAHAHALDNAALSIGVTLTVADLAHGHALDASTLSTGTALAVADAQHAHALDNVTLSTTGATSLTVADLLHAHTLDAVVLTSQTDLAAADMAHGHALDGVTLTLGGISLVIAEIMHAHALDNVALTLDTYLAVADLLHAHTLDNVLVSIPGSALSDAEFRQMYDWISELHLVHGLRAGSPLTVTPTTRAAGIVDQTIGEVGTTVTVTRI